MPMGNGGGRSLTKVRRCSLQRGSTRLALILRCECVAIVGTATLCHNINIASRAATLPHPGFPAITQPHLPPSRAAGRLQMRHRGPIEDS